jgi:hypothetical protein
VGKDWKNRECRPRMKRRRERGRMFGGEITSEHVERGDC